MRCSTVIRASGAINAGVAAGAPGAHEPFRHVPVLLHPVLDAFSPLWTRWRGAQQGAAGGGCDETINIIDCTVGGGGHAAALIAAARAAGCPSLHLFGCDLDPSAIPRAASALRRVASDTEATPPATDTTPPGAPSAAFTLYHGSYTTILPPTLAHVHRGGLPRRVHAILADLGVSSFQLDNPAAGFSFLRDRDGPLDMRFNQPITTTTTPPPGITAADLVNTLPPMELAEVLRRYGQEPHAHAIAHAIQARRRVAAFTRTSDLAQLVASVVLERIPPSVRRRHRAAHPATRTFQALRIAVNGELASVQRLVTEGPLLLSPGGRMAIITFHSLEDGVVQAALARHCAKGAGFVSITPVGTGVKAGTAEVQANVRARSATLHVIQRMAPVAGKGTPALPTPR